jgi:hypothetical protein
MRFSSNAAIISGSKRRAVPRPARFALLGAMSACGTMSARRAVRRMERYAQTRAKMCMAAINRDRPREETRYLACQAHDRGVVVRIVEEQQELVTAKTGRHILAGGRIAQPVGHRGQDVIAACWPSVSLMS